ncbi:hypothetical protein SDC9_101821 [bioreactor metagenome]|uniref:Uncharacterized protein n=1 Tax=bioreactor metagenome TaxID=1076179 RepID=A0A645AQ63_9ZZZZ
MLIRIILFLNISFYTYTLWKLIKKKLIHLQVLDLQVW